MGIMGADGAKPHVLFVDRQGNHHYDRAWKQQVVGLALEPGASLSRVAIDHGINTNLVRKWVRKHKATEMEALRPSPSLGSAFIPVRIEAAANDIVSRHDDAHALNLKVRDSGEMRQAPANAASFSSAAKLHVSLPNGVKLSLECDDARALTAVIGAVSDV
ncbi:MAG: transposase [Agrobacterium sp.]|jgi:transposase|uniref:Transposase n=3 Tax=Alphaproteobacteria TaxID=28211 RepID=A0A512HPX3_9HYPH|nr:MULTISPECIES: transposase [Alphaproteobacteria]MBP8936916.1 transposase [Agrobacterium sp.]MBE0562581.1 transposase [Brucella anthropi]GEO87507.1 transposase [Ciceribacter naphthalenivorans]GLR23214.1 transposase [Ciceribacter naphthalenivorans]GLT06070.1 transposase [Sphingomonas psychrolutea]